MNRRILTTTAVLLLILGESATVAQDENVDNEAKATQKEADYFSERMNANVITVKTSEHRYGYGFIMRRLFVYAKGGRSFGLSDSDVAIIRRAGHPDGKTPMKPYMDHIERLVDAEDQTVYVASLLVDARIAEQDALNDFHRSVIQQLSKDGQRRLQKAYEKEIAKEEEISEIDFVNLAAELPEMMHALLRQAVTNFKDDANNGETQNRIVGASAGIAQEQHVDRKPEAKKFTAKEVEQFQERVNATAVRVKASEHRFGYVHVMRNDFELIRAGIKSDLPDADVAIIRLSHRPDESPMKPYIDDMERLLDAEDQTVHLARLYVDALSALDDADNDFYRSIVPRLSKDAQRRLQKTYEDRCAWFKVTTIDWVILAEEFPKMTRHMIRHGVTSLKQGLERNGGVSAYAVMQSAAGPRE